MDVELGKFLGQLGAAMDRYDERCSYWDKCDKAYEGFYKPKDGGNAKASKWKSQYHPPYVLQVIETIESFIVEGDPTFKVVPLNPESEETAPIMERLLRWQMCKDYFAEKQSIFVKQALCRGLTVAKVAWVDERRMEPVRKFIPAMGNYPVDDPEGPELREVPYKQQPSFIPIDIKNFFWDPSATCMEDCDRVFFRSYSTLEALKAQGIYENLDKLADSKGQSNTYLGANAPHLDDPDYRGKIEVIERWTPGRLTVVANRCEIIRSIRNPFWHGQIPFVIAATMPQPFKMLGKSEVEILADIQTMLWQFQNQRLDNVELINNAIVILQPSSVDEEQYEFFPGAIWKNRNPADVQMWTPNPAFATMSVETERMIKQDLESLSAALPYLSGAASDTIDNKTATGITIVQNMAQKRLVRKKQQINWAYQRAGTMQIKLNQQLLPKSVSIRADRKGLVNWDNISPAQIQGDYDFIIEDVSESMNRQERRAEALAKAQFFISNYPVLVQAGVTPDLNAVVEDVTAAFDESPGKYVRSPEETAQQQAQQPAPPPLPPGMPGLPGLPGMPNGNGGAPAPATGQPIPAGAVPPPSFAANGSQAGGGGY